MTRRLILLLTVGILTAGCFGDHSSEGKDSKAQSDRTSPTPSGGKGFAYRNVHLVVPADWPIRNERTPCPAFNETGLFIVEPTSETPSCASSPPPVDSVRIGPLVGYPPTADGVAPSSTANS